MELENIVANTVYLKARESEYRVGFRRKWRILLRSKARNVVLVRFSTGSQTRRVLSLRGSISAFFSTCSSLLQVKLKAGVRNGKSC